MFKLKLYTAILRFSFSLNRKQFRNCVRFCTHDQNMSTPELSDFQSTCLQKNAGDRKFYSLPDDYNSFSYSDETTESSVLLKEIYNNISSRSAKFHGPFGKRSGMYTFLN